MSLEEGEGCRAGWDLLSVIWIGIGKGQGRPKGHYRFRIYYSFTVILNREMSVRSGHNGGPASVLRFSGLPMPTNGRPSQFAAVVLVFLHWKVLVLSFVSDHRISIGGRPAGGKPKPILLDNCSPPAWAAVLFLGSFLTLAPGSLRIGSVCPASLYSGSSWWKR